MFYGCWEFTKKIATCDSKIAVIDAKFMYVLVAIRTSPCIVRGPEFKSRDRDSLPWFSSVLQLNDRINIDLTAVLADLLKT
jgi:hypothetical protein